MRSRVARAIPRGSVAVALLVAGCVHNFPDSVAPSTAPLPDHYRTTGPRSAETCNVVLFGLFQLSKMLSMSDLVSLALLSDDALIGVTIDRTYLNWFIGNTSCTQIRGDGVVFLNSATASASPGQQDSAGLFGNSGQPARPAGGVPFPAEAQPPASALRVAEMVYVALGWNPEADPERWSKDVWAVVAAMAGGMTAGEILERAIEGQPGEQSGFGGALGLPPGEPEAPASEDEGR